MLKLEKILIVEQLFIKVEQMFINVEQKTKVEQMLKEKEPVIVIMKRPADAKSLPVCHGAVLSRLGV